MKWNGRNHVGAMCTDGTFSLLNFGTRSNVHRDPESAQRRNIVGRKFKSGEQGVFIVSDVQGIIKTRGIGIQALKPMPIHQ